MNSFINYDLPLKKVFNKISFLARYDMMTDHSDGKMDETTKALIINDYARHRVTGGITLSLSKAFIADLRLNFSHDKTFILTIKFVDFKYMLATAHQITGLVNDPRFAKFHQFFCF